MRLEGIDIAAFKNISGATLSFGEGVNCLVGLNGMGKSNMLEAIHLLCMARPLRPAPESSLIARGSESALVKGRFTMDNGTAEEVSCGLMAGKPKKLRRNGKDYKRVSEHIGRFPVVTVSPADVQLAEGSGEVRRRLLDIVVSQADPSYLTHLIRYNKGLESRNRMLRAGMRDKLLFESVEEGMCASAEAVHAARRAWTEETAATFAAHYSAIAGSGEHASLRYRSHLDGSSPKEVFEASRSRDQALGFTSAGIHRDDLDMLLDGLPMRRDGSQGQLKTYTVALRLAVFDYLKARSGATPLLLLDDIFDRLDSRRVANLMGRIAEGGFGQIFIADTDRSHLDDNLGPLRQGRRAFETVGGKFTPL